MTEEDLNLVVAANDELEQVLSAKAEWERAKAAFAPKWQKTSLETYCAALERFWARIQPPEVVELPEGLCGDRSDHAPHRVEYAAVANGPMWCTADQSQRLPFSLERKDR